MRTGARGAQKPSGHPKAKQVEGREPALRLEKRDGALVPWAINSSEIWVSVTRRNDADVMTVVLIRS